MGKIRVTVQTEERLKAINNLSFAIKKVAEALAEGTHVTISDCTFYSSDAEPAVSVDTTQETKETLIANEEGV